MRLTEKGREIGLVNDRRYEAFLEKKRLLQEQTEILEKTRVGPNDAGVERLLLSKGSSRLKKSISLAELFRRPELSAEDLVQILPEGEEIPLEVFEEALIEIKYAGYLEKQDQQVERFKRMEDKALPEDLDYEAIHGLRAEAQQKLSELRPASVGQASRISGVSPADISVLLIYLEHQRRGKQISREEQEDFGGQKNE